MEEHFSTQIEINQSLASLDGWKGSFICSMVAGISFPHCPTFAGTNRIRSPAHPKSIIGPKSRGASSCTTIRHNVEIYYSHFRLFMVIQCSGYFVHACASVLELKLLHKPWIS